MNIQLQIIKSLKWIGIEHDGDEYIQSTKINDHIKVANELIKEWYMLINAIAQMKKLKNKKRELNKKNSLMSYNRKWRDLT